MLRAFLTALVLVSPCAAATPLPSPNWPAPADRGEKLLKNVMLKAHNRARAGFGTPALAWNATLAADAMKHAQYMANTGIYAHDRTPGRLRLQGENMWKGPRGVFSYEVMVGVMIDEEKNFRPGVFPDTSRTGQWRDVGHYTQIVWPTTTEFGCAIATSASTDYFVCRYAPTGNREGMFIARQHELAERRD